MARNMFTRPRDAMQVSERVASRLQCAVARTCSLAAAGSLPAGGISVDISSLLVAGQVPRQVGKGAHSLRREEGGDAVVHLGDRSWVEERCGANLDRGATRDQELQRVLRP